MLLSFGLTTRCRLYLLISITRRCLLIFCKHWQIQILYHVKLGFVNLCRMTWPSSTGRWRSPPPSPSSTSSPPSYRHSINLTIPHSPEQIALLCLLYFCTCTRATTANSTIITFTSNINSLKASLIHNYMIDIFPCLMLTITPAQTT